MALIKINDSEDFHARNGRAVARIGSIGGPSALDRTESVASTLSFATGDYNGIPDNYTPSWASTGHVADTNGVVMFDNVANGGSLASVLVVNRGSNIAYVNFNTSTPSVDGGFPLSSGESIQHAGLISQVSAITSAGQTLLAAQGLYNDDGQF